MLPNWQVHNCLPADSLRSPFGLCIVNLVQQRCQGTAFLPTYPGAIIAHVERDARPRRGEDVLRTGLLLDGCGVRSRRRAECGRGGGGGARQGCGQAGGENDFEHGFLDVPRRGVRWWDGVLSSGWASGPSGWCGRRAAQPWDAASCQNFLGDRCPLQKSERRSGPPWEPRPASPADSASRGAVGSLARPQGPAG